VINQSIKFFSIFLLAFNVFAGGDDRDQEYYEALDEELASFEAQLAEDLANQAALDAFAAELANQTALDAFQQKIADEKAAAAASTAAYQSQLEYDAKVAELMDALQREIENKAFEAELAAELSKQAAVSAAEEMTAEIIAEERAKRLAEFQAKVEAEKAAAARSTEIYQARLLQDQMIKDRQAQLALERELAAFEAQLEADLAKQAAKEAFEEWYSKFLENKAAEEALEKELAAFEAQLEADLAAQEMMAEIIAEEERAKRLARLAEFQAKLEAEKAAAARSTAIYQARLQQEQIIKDNQAKREAKLAEEKAAAAELAAFKAELAAHEECKAALNLSDSNIALFKTALAAGYLGNVGPQVKYGTEFIANRWDKYITCVGLLGN